MSRIRGPFAIIVAALGLSFSMYSATISQRTQQQLNNIFKTEGPVIIMIARRKLVTDGQHQLLSAAEENQLFQDVENTMRQLSDIHKNSLIILIFNETFFKSDSPLDYENQLNNRNTMQHYNQNTMQHYIERLKTMTQGKKVYCVANFLVSQKYSGSQKNLREEQVRYMRKLQMDLNNNKNIPVALPNRNECSQFLANQINNLKSNGGLFYNISYSIFGGQIVSQYLKSSYYHEWDVGLKSGHAYVFGDGKDHIYNFNQQQNKELATSIIREISTEICFDLACGVRKNNNWSSFIGDELLGFESSLHIIQSRYINPKQSLMNLPENSIIIHAAPALSSNVVARGDTLLGSQYGVFYVENKNNKSELNACSSVVNPAVQGLNIQTDFGNMKIGLFRLG